MLTDILFRLKSVLRRRNTEAELDEEVRSHLENLVQKHLQAGASPAEALRRARLEFGGAEQVKEDCRDARGVSLLEAAASDVRFGLRILLKNPGFTAVAVLTLALGIGASTAVFSVVDAILLKPLPYPNPERIVLPWRLPAPGLPAAYTEYPWGRFDFLFLAQESKTFQNLGAFKSDSFNLTGSGEPIRLDGLRASAGFFPALGVEPLLGRTFTPEEDHPGREREVVLGHRLWLEKFGGDPGIVGRSVDLNGAPYAVVGVMPAGFVFPRAEEMPAIFSFPREVQLWVPLALPAGAIIPAEESGLAPIGRVKPGITIAQVQAEMNLLGKRLEGQYPPQAKGWFNSRVTPLAKQVAGDTRRPLLLIFCAVGLVLVIASSNVASLLLARSLPRRKEFTLRAALGAGNARLVRQLLTESILLATVGGLLGFIFAEAGVHFVKTFGPPDIPRLRETVLNLRVFSFTLGITLLAGILFGLAPAIGATRQDLAESLKEGGQRAGGGSGSSRIRKTLLVSEVALAMVLVIAAGLLSRTFFHLLQVDPGFNPEHVLTFELTLPALKYADQAHIVTLHQRALKRLRSLPGVQAAGVVETLPMGGAAESTGIRIPGRVPTAKREALYANYTIISPGYFSAVRTPLLRGRDFMESDTADSMPVAIINEVMAKKYWPGEDPIGKQVGPGSPRYPAGTIVGIVANTKHVSLREEAAPEMYVPYTQKVWPSILTMDVVVRTSADPASITKGARDAIHAVDPDLPLAKVATLKTIADDSMTQQRFSVVLVGSFGVLALVLACVGMYGVISYSVAQRTREIGVRMALGAGRGSVFGMVLGQGAWLAGLGIAIGGASALGATRMMAGYLYGVRPADPLTFLGVSLLLIAVALLACYLPARRATRVDPAIALRGE